MDITVDLLEDLLRRFARPNAATAFARAHGLDVPVTTYEMVWAARTHRLLPTLASAWIQAGVAVGADLRGAVDAHRTRATRYDDLTRELTQLVGPTLRAIKGTTIQNLYPTGWVRRTNDLDVRVATAEQAVAAGRHLRRRGWTTLQLTAITARDTHLLRLEAVDPTTGSLHLDTDRVQLQSFYFRGDAWRLPPRASAAHSERLTPVTHSMIALLEELTRRRLVARDILDFALLVRACAPAQLTDVRAAVLALHIAPEWNRLRRAALDVRLLDPTTIPTLSSRRADTIEDRRRTVRAAWRRIRAASLHTRGQAALYHAGYPLVGLPDPDRVSDDFAITPGPGGGVAFRSPFGSGQLTFRGVA